MRRIGLSRKHIRRLCLGTLFFACMLAAHAQGCSMCRDTTAGSAPQIRSGLRRAIPVLAIPAIALFVGFFALARRSDAWHNSDSELPHSSAANRPGNGVL
ncbi:MAG TPA: hypothetical protein VGY94_02205 [Acidobacteriaceae bacterium]|jgi:hypothetical protein|nr:hypothetical protein [Acidobacteriaceae bacterium]